MDAHLCTAHINIISVFSQCSCRQVDVYKRQVEHVHFVTPDAGQDVFTGKYTSLLLLVQNKGDVYKRQEDTLNEFFQANACKRTE